MHSCDGGFVEIVGIELKINDLLDVNTDVGGNLVEEGGEVLLVNVENIFFIFEGFNTLAHQLVHHCSR